MLVRIAALKAIASFLMSLSESHNTGSRQAFSNLIPGMLQTIADALQAGDEGEVRSALEVFVEVADSQPRFLKKALADCVTGMLHIAANKVASHNYCRCRARAFRRDLIPQGPWLIPYELNA